MQGERPEIANAAVSGAVSAGLTFVGTGVPLSGLRVPTKCVVQ
jgi:hypothetical protein